MLNLLLQKFFDVDFSFSEKKYMTSLTHSFIFERLLFFIPGLMLKIRLKFFQGFLNFYSHIFSKFLETCT